MHPNDEFYYGFWTLAVGPAIAVVFAVGTGIYVRLGQIAAQHRHMIALLTDIARDVRTD